MGPQLNSSVSWPAKLGSPPYLGMETLITWNPLLHLFFVWFEGAGLRGNLFSLMVLVDPSEVHSTGPQYSMAVLCLSTHGSSHPERQLHPLHLA